MYVRENIIFRNRSREIKGRRFENKASKRKNKDKIALKDVFNLPNTRRFVIDMMCIQLQIINF